MLAVDASQLSQRTVVFLIRNDQVLLGYKKTGFGQGNYVGIGGKIEAGETAVAAAIRELKEEISISQPVLSKVGEITFLFPDKPAWSQQVQIFLCSTWDGTPQESLEIHPSWFDKQALPFSQMWADAPFWLSAILNGHTLKGVINFNSDLKVVTVTLAAETFI